MKARRLRSAGTWARLPSDATTLSPRTGGQQPLVAAGPRPLSSTPPHPQTRRSIPPSRSPDPRTSRPSCRGRAGRSCGTLEGRRGGGCSFPQCRSLCRRRRLARPGEGIAADRCPGVGVVEMDPRCGDLEPCRRLDAARCAPGRHPGYTSFSRRRSPHSPTTADGCATCAAAVGTGHCASHPRDVGALRHGSAGAIGFCRAAKSTADRPRRLPPLRYSPRPL